MLRHVTGMELEAYVGERLAKPLGWGRVTYGYRHAPIEHTPGGGGIVLRPRDMLRFAYLLLRGGRWGDRELVPADYVHQASRATRYNPHSPYSFQFNVNTDGDVAGLPRDVSGRAERAGTRSSSCRRWTWSCSSWAGGTGNTPANTGFPKPENADALTDAQENPSPTEGHESGNLRTLALVIAALER